MHPEFRAPITNTWFVFLYIDLCVDAQYVLFFFQDRVDPLRKELLSLLDAASDKIGWIHSLLQLFQRHRETRIIRDALQQIVWLSFFLDDTSGCHGMHADGLMQLLPSTASDEVHRFLYGTRGNVGFNELAVPEINIRYGTAYLHILMTRYFQDVRDPVAREYCTVAAYNMGPNRFLRYWGATNAEAVARINSLSVPDLYRRLTVELPVRETRSYVAKVQHMNLSGAAERFFCRVGKKDLTISRHAYKESPASCRSVAQVARALP